MKAKDYIEQITTIQERVKRTKTGWVVAPIDPMPVRYNESGIVGVDDKSGFNVPDGIAGPNVNPHYECKYSEYKYLNYSERVAMARRNGIESVNAEIDSLAFFIAWKIAGLMTFNRIGQPNTAKLDPHFLKRQKSKRQRATETGFPTVTQSTIEEMALAARAELIQHWGTRNAQGRFPESLNERTGKRTVKAMTDSFAAARKAYNRERERELKETVPDNRVLGESARDVLRVYARANRLLRKYWSESTSRKSKAGLKGELQILKLETRKVLYGKGEYNGTESKARYARFQMRKHLIESKTV